MADPITQRTDELEGGLNDLQQQMSARAAAPAALTPTTPVDPQASDTPASTLYYPAAAAAAINPDAAPVEPPAPTTPPTWDEVQAHPEFQTQSPAEKAATYARWHDATYNFVSALPDWEPHKADFNQGAADEEKRLLSDAGLNSVAEARAKIADEAIKQAQAANGNEPLGRQQMRDVLGSLDPDVRQGYFDHKIASGDENANDDWDFSTGLSTDIVKSALSTMAQTAIGAGKGVVRYAESGIPTEAELEGKYKGQLGLDTIRATREKVKGFGDFLDTWREEVPKGVGVKEGTVPTQIGEFAGGLAPYFVALPAAVVAHVGGAYGDTYDKTGGDKLKSAGSAALAGATDLLFMELAKYTSGLGKGLANPIARWASSAAAGTAGNIGFQQLVKAGEAAITAPPDKRYEAFKSALSDLNLKDAGVQAAFALLATKHAESRRPLEQARVAIEKLKAEAQDAITKAAKTAPATAETLRQQTEETAKQIAEAAQAKVEQNLGPRVQLGHKVDVTGEHEPYANIPKDATMEELQSAKDNLPPASPDGTSQTDQSNRFFHEELDKAIAEKQKEFAPPAATEPEKAPEDTRPSHERIAEAQREIAAARTAGDSEAERVATDKLNAVAAELIGQQNTARTEAQNENPELTDMGKRNGAQYEGPESNGKHSFTLLDEGKETTFQMPNKFTEAELQEKIADKRRQFGPENAPAPTYTRRTPEEQQAAERAGVTYIRDLVAQTGRVPKVSEIRRKTGNNAQIAKELHAELTAALGEAHPSEAPAQGETITTVKHPLTGDELPSVVSAPNEAGVRTTRPQFVNNPEILGQMIDQGMISGDKANRLYIPDELVDADQVNPAIARTMKFDRDTKQWYVDGVETRHGLVDSPDQYTKAERASRQFTQAQQHIVLDPEKLSALRESLKGDLAAHGLSEDAVRFNEEAETADADRKAGDVSIAPENITEPESPRDYTPDPLVREENLRAAKAIGLVAEKGQPEPTVESVLNNIANNPRVPEWMRLIAQITKKAGYDLNNLKLSVEYNPRGYWAGKFMHETRTNRINLAHRHGGGVVGTFMHELFHGVLDGKLLAESPRNPIEQRAYDLLNRIHREVAKHAYREYNPDHEPTDTEIDRFMKAQFDRNHNDYIGAEYYGLSNIHEFVNEALTNPRFQRFLANIEQKAVPAERPLFRKVLDTIKTAAKQLFTGKEVKPTSALDHALNHALELLQQGPTTAGRLDVLSGHVRAPENRPDIGMSADELANEISGDPPAEVKQSDVRPNGTSNAYEPTKEVRGDGWVGPDGQFYRNTSDMRAADMRIKGVEAPQFGGHEEAAWQLIQDNPRLAKAFEATAEKLGYEHINEMDIGEIKDFMERNGFLRVMHIGRDVAFTGRPEGEALRKLTDYAIANERPLIHDRETGGELSHKVLYEPPTGNAKAGSDTTSDRITSVLERRANAAERGRLGLGPLSPEFERMMRPEAAPADEADSETKPATVKYKQGPAGRRNVEINGLASPAQLESVNRLIEADKEATPATKEALKEQIELAARQNEPVMVDRIAVGKRRLKDSGVETIVAGANSAENLPRIIADKLANRVALDFGATKGKAGKALALDRKAATLIVDEGKDLKRLQAARERVANSRSLQNRETFTPIYDYAIENFDRLKQKKAHDEAMKELIEREHAYDIDTPELKDYVTHLLDSPTAEQELLPASNGQGGTRYFTKARTYESLADAIHDGFVPKTLDIAELDHHRIEASERLIQQKQLHAALKAVHAPDGKPIISTTEPRQTLYQGEKQAVPRGYQLVTTGGVPLVVHNDYVPLMRALYGQRGMNALTKYAGWAKRNTLVLDTFHVGRVMMKEASYSKGMQRFGYGKGLSVLEYSPEDLNRAVEVGDITPSQRDYVLKHHEDAQGLIRNGLNVAKVSDNMNAELAKALPFIKNFNPWVFQKLSRGAMLQTALENLQRNRARFHELSPTEALQKTAKEMNEVFGNLQKQSIFKGAGIQDAMRTIFLAPQWAESQLKSELRGYGQILKAPVDIARGNFRLGTVAQGQITATLGMFAAMQVASLIMNGRTTFQNPKKDWFALHIPGGRAGFEFNPMEISGEYAFQAYKYLSQHMTPADVVQRIAFNKLNPVPHGVLNFLLDRDYSGKQYATQGDRSRALLESAIPLPPVMNSLIERDPRQHFSLEEARRVRDKHGFVPSTDAAKFLAHTLGMRPARAPGAEEKSALQSAGFKVSAGLTPRSEIFALAHRFRDDKGYSDNSPPQYRELRSALDNRNEAAVRDELYILADRGKTEDQIKTAVGITHGGVQPEKFTGNKDREVFLKNSLTPEQHEIYKQAQIDHKANAQYLRKVLSTLKMEDADLVKKLHANAKKPRKGDFE